MAADEEILPWEAVPGSGGFRPSAQGAKVGQQRPRSEKRQVGVQPGEVELPPSIQGFPSAPKGPVDTCLIMGRR